MNFKPKKIAGWLLLHVGDESTRDRAGALAIIFFFMIVIGLSDYLTGIHLSLILFYFVPVALAVVWLGGRVAASVAIGCTLMRVAGDVAANDNPELPMWILWNGLSALMVFLILIWILNAFVSLHRILEQRVKERTAALVEATSARRKLEEELLEVGSRERNMIGHELHDEICQHLVGTALAAQVLAQRLAEKNSVLTSDAETIVGLLEKGADMTRQLAKGLLLSEIEPEKLCEKLSEIADQASGSGIVCRFRQEGDILVSDAGIAAHLFRIAHEALRNALKHAEPHHVEISLAGTDLGIDLMVEDDGIGIANHSLQENAEMYAKNSGMGLRIMSNRALLIGATFSVCPGMKGGTQMICHLPHSRI